MNWIFLPATVLITLCALLMSRRLLHVFQLESYQYHGYRKSVIRLYKRCVIPFALFGILLAAGLFCADKLLLKDVTGKEWILSGMAFVCVAVFTVFICKSDRKRVEKKKFVLTARMKRLCV